MLAEVSMHAYMSYVSMLAICLDYDRRYVVSLYPKGFTAAKHIVLKCYGNILK